MCKLCLLKWFFIKKAFALDIVKPLSESFELWDDEGEHTDRLLKTMLIDFLCRMQDEKCLERAGDFFYTIPDDYFDFPNDPRFNNT